MFAKEPNKGSTANARVSFVSALWREESGVNSNSKRDSRSARRCTPIAHLPSNLWTICRNFDVIAVFWVRMLFWFAGVNGQLCCTWKRFAYPLRKTSTTNSFRFFLCGRSAVRLSKKRTVNSWKGRERERGIGCLLVRLQIQVLNSKNSKVWKGFLFY